MALVERVMGKPIRGVNLGGWLVLEPWMTPSLFVNSDAVDEYTYCSAADSSVKKHLTQFRNTFITEHDFVWLAKQGVQAVRLPIGYWLYGDCPPFIGTKTYVDLAFVWAKKHGLKILLDLHGAPGSQNGEMHSGKAGDTGWHRNPINITQTLEVLGRIAKDYGHHPALLGISVLNEASPRIPRRVLVDFYEQAYTLLKASCHAEAWIVCSDAFRPGRWHRLFPQQQYPGLYFDYHHYQIFSWLDRLLPARIQLWRTQHTVPAKLRRMARHHPIIVGEWSAALRSGLLYERQEYYAAQVKAFGAADAYFYWNYKTEYGGPWSFRES